MRTFSLTIRNISQRRITVLESVACRGWSVPPGQTQLRRPPSSHTHAADKQKSCWIIFYTPLVRLQKTGRRVNCCAPSSLRPGPPLPRTLFARYWLELLSYVRIGVVTGGPEGRAPHSEWDMSWNLCKTVGKSFLVGGRVDGNCQQNRYT